MQSVVVKKNNSTEYPYTHNLTKLLKEANVKLTNEQIEFYSDMNLFQAKGRYPETLESIENIITSDTFNKYNNKLRAEIKWLTDQLQ